MEALIPDLTAVVTWHANSIDTSIKCHFLNVFESETAILASLTFPSSVNSTDRITAK